jgi:hypothetical protein
MHIDTAEYQMIRGEIARLEDDLGRVRGSMATLAELVTGALAVITGRDGRRAEGARLAKVIDFPGGGR